MSSSTLSRQLSSHSRSSSLASFSDNDEAHSDIASWEVITREHLELALAATIPPATSPSITIHTHHASSPGGEEEVDDDGTASESNTADELIARCEPAHSSSLHHFPDATELPLPSTSYNNSKLTHNLWDFFSRNFNRLCMAMYKSITCLKQQARPLKSMALKGFTASRNVAGCLWARLGNMFQTLRLTLSTHLGGASIKLGRIGCQVVEQGKMASTAMVHSIAHLASAVNRQVAASRFDWVHFTLALGLTAIAGAYLRSAHLNSQLKGTVMALESLQYETKKQLMDLMSMLDHQQRHTQGLGLLSSAAVSTLKPKAAVVVPIIKKCSELSSTSLAAAYYGVYGQCASASASSAAAVAALSPDSMLPSLLVHFM